MRGRAGACAGADRASWPVAKSAISCTAPPDEETTAPEGGLPGADGVGRQLGEMRTSYPGSADWVQVPLQDVVAAGLVTTLLARSCAAHHIRPSGAGIGERGLSLIARSRLHGQLGQECPNTGNVAYLICCTKIQIDDEIVNA